MLAPAANLDFPGHHAREALDYLFYTYEFQYEFAADFYCHTEL
jgi:hypothetical protein